MTLKIIFERSSQRGSAGGFEKRVNRGTTLKFYFRPKAQEKQHFGKSHFCCRRFVPGNAVTIILDNYTPSTLQGVGLRGSKNPRLIVGEKFLSFRRLLRGSKSFSPSPGPQENALFEADVQDFRRRHP